jgi:hypothetical protein
MAIYRPRRSPWPLAVVLAGLAMLIGFGVGYAVFGTRPPDLGAATEVVQERLTEARGLLEVAAIEYREGAPSGSIANQPEYDAATRAVTRAQDAVDAVDEPLRTLAPDRAAALEDGFSAIGTLMSEVAPPDAIDDAVDAQIELLVSPPS